MPRLAAQVTILLPARGEKGIRDNSGFMGLCHNEVKATSKPYPLLKLNSDVI